MLHSNKKNIFVQNKYTFIIEDSKAILFNFLTNFAFPENFQSGINKHTLDLFLIRRSLQGFQNNSHKKERVKDGKAG
ncbi:MAG: hypothetical protein JWP12_2824 [Bacteroidetes bacterium]|nr:hypothetical protein [Bacteroidota bacterium]